MDCVYILDVSGQIQLSFLSFSHPRPHFHPDSLRSATINTNLPTPTTHPTLDALYDNLLRYPQDSPATDITKH
ncbi:hypothetical protein HZ326_22515 [Fusarium oxysporum f. sp. albedinis]|nr:hypothetical protein HZ326_22515 [Fusarium oxysporum f. sp. albedinis]